MKIKRNDIVIPISGSHAGAGKSGKVLQVLPETQRAIVEGINLVKKHMRKSQDHPRGAIVEKEMALPLSNLALYCPHDKKGVRVKVEREAGKRIRKCKVCGHAFDT